MKFTFLGTGAGLPSKERNVSSIALSLLQEINSVWLFDCGEATQHQILHTTIRPRKISKIFITHLHGDHIFGLPGLLGSRSFQNGKEPLHVYGPPGIKKYIETSLDISRTHLTYPLHITEISEGLVFSNESFSVECIELDHGIQCFGYKIKENDQLGELLIDRLIERGIKPGPIYKEIKSQPVTTLPNGETIQRNEVLGPPKKGLCITIFGDTRNTNKYKEFVRDTDVLIHEATFDQSKKQLAQQYYHSTTEEAAQLAKDSNVQQLILTHISARYRKDEIQQLLNEAKAIFPKTIIAYDLMNVTLDINK